MYGVTSVLRTRSQTPVVTRLWAIRPDSPASGSYTEGMATPAANHDAGSPSVQPGAGVEAISAVTLVTADMARAVRFYEALGFRRTYGGPQTAFTTFAVGGSYLNLVAETTATPLPPWGRVIFHVSDVDTFYDRAIGVGLSPQSSPRDAEWGERYFHLSDPDGHELSFARPLPETS